MLADNRRAWNIGPCIPDSMFLLKGERLSAPAHSRFSVGVTP